MRKLLLEKVDGSLSDLKAYTELAKQRAEMILSVASSTREKLIRARTQAESKWHSFKSTFFMWLKWKFSFVLATKEGFEGDQFHSDLQLARDGTEVVQSAQGHLFWTFCTNDLREWLILHFPFYQTRSNRSIYTETTRTKKLLIQFVSPFQNLPGDPSI